MKLVVHLFIIFIQYKHTSGASDKVTMKVTSSMTLTISRTTEKKYICWVNGTTNNYTLDISSIEVVGLTPDTAYPIGCVEVDEDGHYQCTEYNTTVVTGDQISINCNVYAFIFTCMYTYIPNAYIHIYFALCK